MTPEKVMDQTRAAISALARVVYALERKDHEQAALGFQRAHDLIKQAARTHCDLELKA